MNNVNVEVDIKDTTKSIPKPTSTSPEKANSMGDFWLTYTPVTPGICTISNDGKITPISTGRTSVQVKNKITKAQTSCTVTVGESFNYISTKYNADLAEKCAEYAMLAYDEMEWDSGKKRYVDRGKKFRKSQPDELIRKLKSDGFKVENKDAHYFNDDKPHNVSYVIARKDVLRGGIIRPLVVIIIRGTDNDEWKGNMDVAGEIYDPSLNDHYSFKAAEDDLITNKNYGLTTYLTTYGITNPVYLITGHSRGAAVANLLAYTLTSISAMSNVFAYTFATPNNTKTPNLSRNNIRNFCFTDDFVPQVPLEDWNYGKHGITHTKTAGDLYANSNTFKKEFDDFLIDSERSNAKFNPEGTKKLLEYVSDNWKTVDDYYKKYYGGVTLYWFFRNRVAPAAMGDILTGVLVIQEANAIPPTDFTPIAKYFVSGSNIPVFGVDYIYDTHHEFTYYTAVKHRLFI